MTHPLFHPEAEEISLPSVLTALGDDTRLSIIAILARNGERAMTCGEFLELGSKTALSYHVARLREAGVINVRPDGTRRLLTLRRLDLENRFPGILDSIITSASAMPLAQHQGVAKAAEIPGETEWT
jgi:DNA-binding transcriptional ArsR family regulator